MMTKLSTNSLRALVRGYALDKFATRTRAWVQNGRDAYIFMINGAKIRAPAAALALQERLR